MQYMLALCLVMGSWSSEKIDWCSLKCGERLSTMCETDFKTYTEDCEQNDPCPVSPDFWLVGQNVAAYSSKEVTPDLNGTKSFRAWIGEIKNVREKPLTIINSFNGSYNYGHFTQIIWADSHKLGCAQITYQNAGWHNMMIFCYFGIGGNAIGDKIYIPGKPCSNCPPDTMCKRNSRYRSLCALPSDSRQPENIEGPSRSLIEDFQSRGYGSHRSEALTFTAISFACSTMGIHLKMIYLKS